MEVLETPRKILPGGSSLAQESGVKAFEEGSKTSSAETKLGQGVRVAINGEEAFGEGLGLGAVATKGSFERDFGDQKFVALDDDEGRLEDSEMNGVSSLLQMHGGEKFVDKDGKRNFESGGVKTRRKLELSMNDQSFDSNLGCAGREVEEESEGEDSEGFEDMGDGGHKFSVGDFVWGKIKSYPWWPGRIYDPLDASDYAKKLKRRDKMLVAYFGDGTFAWCSPSQLKPFEDNFAEMSKQTSLKNFVNAVAKAVDEVGRLVDMKMTCSCVAKENLIGFGRSLAMNSGIRDGLLVPEGGIEKFSNALFEPEQLVSALRGCAQVATISNMLHFSVLKNWLSAFYRARGGYQLPTYYEPQPIPGLEDDTTNQLVDSSTYNGGIEVSFQGPVEEEWLSPHKDLKFGENAQFLLRKCEGASYQRRKQKSIAEIMGTHANTEAENENENSEAEGETNLSKQTSFAEREKRKGRGKTDAEGKGMAGDLGKGGPNWRNAISLPGGEADNKGKNEVGDVDKGETSSGELPSSFGRKKRKFGNEVDGQGKVKVGDVAKATANPSKQARSSGSKKRKVIDEANVDGGTYSTSIRGKEAVLSDESLVAAEAKVSSSEADGVAVKKKSEKSSLSMGRRKKGGSSVEIDGEGNRIVSTMYAEKKMDDEAAKQIERGLASRERKKSKYLSPPYTNLSGGQRKIEMEAEIHRKPSKEPDATNETSDESCPQTAKQDQENLINARKVEASANVMLSQIRSAAIDMQHLKESNSLEAVEGFFSAFRNSNYRNALYYRMYNRQPGRKRKSQDSEPMQSLEGQNRNDHSSIDEKSQLKNSKKNVEVKLVNAKAKKAASAPDLKTNDKNPEGRAPAAALFVTFGPGSSLPSKNDLIRIYGKFGDLITQETEMFYNNHCARIVFFNVSEAEEAFNDSQLASPFGSDKVTFRLRYLSADTKTRDLREVVGPNPSPVNKGLKTQDESSSASQSSSGDASQLKYIRQKLEAMISMLDMSDGKMSLDMKSKLESEMRGLLEKVNTMVPS